MHELFFGTTKEAQAAASIICQTPCPVRLECLEFALHTRQPAGVWGGMSTKERKLLLKNGGL